MIIERIVVNLLSFRLDCALEAAYLLAFTCLHFSKSGLLSPSLPSIGIHLYPIGDFAAFRLSPYKSVQKIFLMSAMSLTAIFLELGGL